MRLTAITTQEEGTNSPFLGDKLETPLKCYLELPAVASGAAIGTGWVTTGSITPYEHLNSSKR